MKELCVLFLPRVLGSSMHEWSAVLKPACHRTTPLPTRLAYLTLRARFDDAVDISRLSFYFIFLVFFRILGLQS